MKRGIFGGTAMFNKDESDLKSKDLEMISPRRGEVRSGKVVKIDVDGIWVDIGYKTEGYVSRTELSEETLKIMSSGALLGQEVLFQILKIIGEESILLSEKRALMQKTWNTVKQAHEKQEILKYFVVEEIKGGLLVDIGGGLKGFVPASHIGLKFTKDRSKYIGKKIKARVLQYDPSKKSVILSQKVVLEEEENRRKEKLFNSLKIGDIKWIKIIRIDDEGIKVSYGGINGIIPIDELSWRKIRLPVKFLKEGDVIRAYVLEVDGEKQTIKFSLKLAQTNPWEQFNKIHPEDSIVDGKVVRVDGYGVFIRIGWIVGLVPFTELSWGRNVKPQDLYKEGDHVKARVTLVDIEKQRVNLSIKKVKTDPWDNIETRFNIGDLVEGQITKVYDFGGFLQVEDGIEGLIPFSEITFKRIKNPRDILNEGDHVKARIINVKRDERKLTLSLKSLEEDPWNNIEQKYPFNSYARGTVVKIASFGVFVELEAGVEGLIPLSHLTTKKIVDPKEVINEGQEVVAKVIYVSKERRRVTLSLSLIRIDNEYDEIKKYLESQKLEEFTLKEIMQDLSSRLMS